MAHERLFDAHAPMFPSFFKRHMKTRKQRARNTEKTQAIRRKYAWNTGLKRSVLNEVLNVHFKRLNNSTMIFFYFVNFIKIQTNK